MTRIAFEVREVGSSPSQGRGDRKPSQAPDVRVDGSGRQLLGELLPARAVKATVVPRVEANLRTSRPGWPQGAHDAQAAQPPGRRSQRGGD